MGEGKRNESTRHVSASSALVVPPPRRYLMVAGLCLLPDLHCTLGLLLLSPLPQTDCGDIPHGCDLPVQVCQQHDDTSRLRLIRLTFHKI